MKMEVSIELKNEIYKAMETLGADHHVLCIIGSWGDTMNDKETYEGLKEYNKGDGLYSEIHAMIEPTPSRATGRHKDQ